jgi:hypothetical protein
VVPVGPMTDGLLMIKQIAAMSLAVRALLALSITLGLDGLLLVPLPVNAQEITNAFVRGTDVALRSEPAADGELVTTLQLGDAIRITGDAETESGETKPVTVDTLGVTRVWFVPVEVVETGEVGWIAELFIDRRRLNETVFAATSGPENTPDPTVVPTPTTTATQVPTASPAPTATQVPTAIPTPTATPVPTAIPSPTAIPTPTATPVPIANATPAATPPTQPQGVVDRAKEWMGPSCEDGIGRTFTAEELESNSHEIIDEVLACAGSESTPSLLAECSPPTEGTRKETALIICLVTVANFGRSNDIVATADDFTLLSNTDSYEVNIDVSRPADPALDITSQPVPVPQGDSVLGVVAFDVPEEVAQKDMVLQWTGAGPIETVSGGLDGLQILVQAREPLMAGALTFVQSVPSADSQGVQESVGAPSYTGTSDEVIGPLDLSPGLYLVSARFTGDENFVIWVRQDDGTSDLLVNEIGDYSGESTFTVETSTQVVLEVEGIGPWELQIEKLM